MRASIRFYLGSELHEIGEVSPNTTLLDWLRLDQRRVGSKEGCAEGDCGACTIVVGRLRDGMVRYEAINSCIRPLLSLDGCHILTVEHLKAPDGSLHPVQHAMVDLHASQCGFCTPGFVMSLFAMYLEGAPPDMQRIEDALAGNLCRCTGYRPIVDAALHVLNTPRQEGIVRDMGVRLAALQDRQDIAIEHSSGVYRAPVDCDGLADILSQHPGAVMVAGATDVAHRITKTLERFPLLVDLGRISALREVTADEEHICFGAMADLQTVRANLGTIHPHLDEVMRRFGSEQIRNAGTIGGNIANGSPIGDLPPVLIALGAHLTLRSKAGRREMPLEAFFLEYRKQDRKPGEYLEAIKVPRLPAGALLHVSKISKRFDEDISSVCGAFRIVLGADARITEARLAFGGMAGIPKRAAHAEAALTGSVWSESAAMQAAVELEKDFQPLTDMRASARYRMTVAKNLLRRFALETTQGVPARVAGPLKAVAHA